MDSWGPSPGANDNASGVGTVLELARDLKDTKLAPTLEFVLFGDEEKIDDNPDHHHYGSRAFVAQMTPEERASLAGVISLDMVAYGNTFTVWTMGKGPQTMRALLKTYAAANDTKLVYKQDTSGIGFSDHEPFELAGFPAAWIEWRLDDTHHTAADDYEHCSRKRVQATGDFVLGFLDELTLDDLQKLTESRTVE
jgi:aminopeptidase YwaD